ncbi:MAG: hypothetical protein GY863_02820 [bacterium]|nr:hypothetical protein [bacterium]
MLKTKLHRILFCAACIYLVNCTNNMQSQELTGDYLGQKLPGDSPELFAPGIITHGFHEHGIAISPDGKEIFYVTTDNRYSQYIIIHIKRENNIWSKPEVASFSGQYIDFEPEFSSDGNKLYFSSNRPVNGNEPLDENINIWYIERTGNGWSDPVNIGAPVNTVNGELNQTLAANGNIYYQYFEERGLSSDIYFSRYQNGQYSTPIRLDNGINTDHNEASPFIAPDESYLMFHSNRPGTLGSMDIYISFRQEDGSWGEPINMGEPVNSPAPDNIPYVTPDGKYFFFSSYRTLDPGQFKGKTYNELLDLYKKPQNGYMTIFWMDAGFIEGLRNKE